jgi:hypothetical protein
MPTAKDFPTGEPALIDAAASSWIEDARRALKGTRDALEAAAALHVKETKKTLRRLEARQTKLAAEPAAAKDKPGKKAGGQKKAQESAPPVPARPEDLAALIELARVRAQEAEAVRKAYRRAFDLLEKDLEKLSGLLA